jgi:hypothetical protein
MAFISRRIRSLAGAERGHDLVVADASREGTERHRELARIDTEAGQHAARLQAPKTTLERLLEPAGLDRHIDAAATGQPHDLGHRVELAEVDGQAAPS